VVFALALFDWQIVDAGDAQTHQAMLVEFPVLVAVAAEPVAAVVVPFIGKAYGDAVLSKGPDLLDQPVVEFMLPFACQKGFDSIAPSKNSARLRQRLSLA
jgi:2-keto-3-deoxy-L-rhamnonate aldolase RhmA